MLRSILSQTITEIFNDIMPEAVGDKWGNPRFTVIYDKIGIHEAHIPLDPDDLWSVAGQLDGGRIMVMALTDDNSPLDLLPMVTYLLKHPIIFKPSPDVEAGSYAVQMKLIPSEINDMMFETGFISVIYCELSNAYLLVRTESEAI